MLVWVSRQASLHSSLHVGIALVCREVVSGKWVCQWRAKLWVLHNPAVASGKWVCQASESVTSVMQPDRLAWSCDHVGVTTVKRPDPLLVSAPSSCHTGDSNSCPPELYALTKWQTMSVLADKFIKVDLKNQHYTLGTFITVAWAVL